jgi:hypothetical protein
MTEFASAIKDFMLAAQTLGPWGVVFFLWWDSRKQDAKWQSRFTSVEEMYKNNVKLVEAYEKMAGGYQDIVIFNTQKITGVIDRVDNNLFCPIVKDKTKPKEVHG